MRACTNKKCSGKKSGLVFGISKKTFAHSGDVHFFKFSISASTDIPEHLATPKPNVKESIYSFSLVHGSYNLLAGEWSFESSGKWLRLVNVDPIDPNNESIGDVYEIDTTVTPEDTFIFTNSRVQPQPYTP